MMDPLPALPAEARRARPLDQPLLSCAHWRNISRHAAARNRAASRPRILAHRFRPHLPSNARRRRKRSQIRECRSRSAAPLRQNPPRPVTRVARAGPKAEKPPPKNSCAAAISPRATCCATRKTRMQKIVAWNAETAERRKPAPRTASPCESVSAPALRFERIREVLTATRGPLPLPCFWKKRTFPRRRRSGWKKRAMLAHLGRTAHARRRSLGHGFHPSHERAERRAERSARRNLALACCGKIRGGIAARRHGQRQNGSLSRRDRSRALARQVGDRAGAGNRAHAVGRPAGARAIWRRRGRAAQRPAGYRARARMVARAPRRSARRRRHALRGFRAARKSRPHHRGRRAGVELQAGRNAALQRPRHGRLSRAARRRGRAARLGHAFA